MKHFCHHCGVQGHTRPNCFKLPALKRADSLRGQDNLRRMPKGVQAKGENEGHLIGDVMAMLKKISSCQASPQGLRVMSVVPLHLGILSKTLIQCE